SEGTRIIAHRQGVRMPWWRMADAGRRIFCSRHFVQPIAAGDDRRLARRYGIDRARALDRTGGVIGFLLPTGMIEPLVVRIVKKGLPPTQWEAVQRVVALNPGMDGLANQRRFDILEFKLPEARRRKLGIRVVAVGGWRQRDPEHATVRGLGDGIDGLAVGSASGIPSDGPARLANGPTLSGRRRDHNLDAVGWRSRMTQRQPNLGEARCAVIRQHPPSQQLTLIGTMKLDLRMRAQQIAVARRQYDRQRHTT